MMGPDATCDSCGYQFEPWSWTTYMGDLICDVCRQRLPACDRCGEPIVRNLERQDSGEYHRHCLRQERIAIRTRQVAL